MDHFVVAFVNGFLTLITSSAGALELDSMRLRSQRVIIIIIINGYGHHNTTQQNIFTALHATIKLSVCLTVHLTNA